MQKICPVPYKWNEFWELIGQPGHLPPLILSGWAFSTDRQKRERFGEQVVHAMQVGRGVLAQRFLDGLSEKEWYFCAEEHLDFDYGAALIEESRKTAMRDDD